MAKGKNQHVVPQGDKWAVKGAGNSKATSLHPTQKQATVAATEIAKNQQSEVLVHGQNGRIRSKDSFGSDPNPPRDREH
ncbi:MAG: DUF2188 domain-containing protein [Chloroflexota bacterium]|nr:DUF2188 domain-containing protein [Chloroflexota bacterium]